MAKIQFTTDLIEKPDGLYVRTVIEGKTVSDVGPIPTREMAERVQEQAHASTIAILGAAKERLLEAIRKMAGN